MRLRRLVIFLMTTAVTLGASADSQEDKNSVAALANSINRKFTQVFERFDQLEAKMNQIIENQSGQIRCPLVETLAEGGTEGPVQIEGRPAPVVIKGCKINANLKQITDLQRIQSERKSGLLFVS